jgi:tetrahydromethanopterin S-methyltransferase subunit F
MKMFVVLALVGAAMAEPEADPLLYSGLASTYTHGLASPFVRSVYNPVNTYGSVVAPVSTYRSSVIPAYTGYTGYTGYAGYHGLGKREAEAEPEAEADPLLYSGLASTYTHGLASPFVRSAYNPVTTYGSVVAPVSTYRSAVIPAYNGYTGYTGYTGYRHFGKREAEAEPYTIYSHPAYTGYTGYNRGYSGYNTGYPLRSIHHGIGYSNLYNTWG